MTDSNLDTDTKITQTIETKNNQPQKRKVPTALEVALKKADAGHTTDQEPFANTRTQQTHTSSTILSKETESGKPTGRTITLGIDVTTGKPVAIDNKDRVRGSYILGRTGFGKSILLEQLAVQDA